LRRLAYVLNSLHMHSQSRKERAAANVLRIALSRTIVTKDRGSSLARDVSHSRPHRASRISTYDVFDGFERSQRRLRQILLAAPPLRGAIVCAGDARRLTGVQDHSVDAVLTSPPYLNAIDYMRGHRLSLIWLGYDLKGLRQIRSNSLGAERYPDSPKFGREFESIRHAIGPLHNLPSRFQGIVDRYCQDVLLTLKEVTRVLRPGGRATFVIGNSCIRGSFIRNADAIAKAAKLRGLQLVRKRERELPARHRYLPIPTRGTLGKRIRTETILRFVMTGC
jgi:hypothetical protein